MPGITTTFGQPATRRIKKAKAAPEVSMKIRLNYTNPKEQKIIEALAACGQREMSRFLKRAAYQLATGLDYDTGLPLYAAVGASAQSSQPSKPAPSADVQKMMATLAALDDGLSDWESLHA